MEPSLPTVLPYSWLDIDALISKAVPALARLGIEAVLGISPGGVVPAAIIANRLNKDLHVLESAKLSGFSYKESALLLVSDLDGSLLLQSVASRLTFHNAVLQSSYQSRLLIKTLSVHVWEGAMFKPDIVLDSNEVPKTAWVQYPWE